MATGECRSLPGNKRGRKRELSSQATTLGIFSWTFLDGLWKLLESIVWELHCASNIWQSMETGDKGLQMLLNLNSQHPFPWPSWLRLLGLVVQECQDGYQFLNPDEDLLSRHLSCIPSVFQNSWGTWARLQKIESWSSLPPPPPP